MRRIWCWFFVHSPGRPEVGDWVRDQAFGTYRIIVTPCRRCRAVLALRSELAPAEERC